MHSKKAFLILMVFLLFQSISAYSTPVGTACPVFTLPQTSHYDGGNDVITLVSGGPVDYHWIGEIPTDNYRQFGEGEGTLNNGESITITYPPIGTWGPADQYGAHEVHTTIHFSGSWGYACGEFNNYLGHNWDRWYHDYEYPEVPEFSLVGGMAILSVAGVLILVMRKK